MKYKSVDELEHFEFKDAVLHGFIWKPESVGNRKLSADAESTLMDGVTKGTLTLALEAVIVKPENSQNSNFYLQLCGGFANAVPGRRNTESGKRGI